jgi:hypothetical protein
MFVMRRLATLLVVLAFVAMPVTLVARIHGCAAMPCCRHMDCLMHSSAEMATTMPGHHDAGAAQGLCVFTGSCPCHGHTPWGLTALILPIPPPAAQGLPLPKMSRSRLAFASPGELGGFGYEPFEPPRS